MRESLADTREAMASAYRLPLDVRLVRADASEGKDHVLATVAAGLVMLVAPYWASLGLTLLLWSTVSVWSISAGAALIAASSKVGQGS